MTTPEELRAESIQGVDAILDAPWIVRKLISNEKKRLLRAQRTYWQQVGIEQLEKLKTLYDAEPLQQDTPKVGEIV